MTLDVMVPIYLRKVCNMKNVLALFTLVTFLGTSTIAFVLALHGSVIGAVSCGSLALFCVPFVYHDARRLLGK